MLHKTFDRVALSFPIHRQDERSNQGSAHTIDGQELLPGRTPIKGGLRRIVHGGLLGRVNCSGGKRGPVAELVREILGRRFAEMPDAQAEQKPMEVDPLALMDRKKELFRRLISPAFLVLEPLLSCAVTLLQQKDVGQFGNPSTTMEVLNLLRSESLDVKSAARNEVLELLYSLRATNLASGASTDGIPFFPDGGRPANGTFFRELVWFSVLWSLGEINVRDLRDHVTRPVDLHPVTRPNVLAVPDLVAARVAPGDVVLVVKGGI